MVSSYADINDIVLDYLVFQFSDSPCKLGSSSSVVVFFFLEAFFIRS